MTVTTIKGLLAAADEAGRVIGQAATAAGEHAQQAAAQLPQPVQGQGAAGAGQGKLRDLA